VQPFVPEIRQDPGPGSSRDLESGRRHCCLIDEPIVEVAVVLAVVAHEDANLPRPHSETYRFEHRSFSSASSAARQRLFFGPPRELFRPGLSRLLYTLSSIQTSPFCR
jgi:hypothetical protein